MLPISDDNRGRRSQPYVTYTLLAISILIFVYQAILSEDEMIRFILNWGAIPAEISGGQRLLTVLTCIFLHGSWLHLGSNMLFLWIFGDNVEDVMGHLRFLTFYLATGIAATAAQVWFNPESTVPTVGASGAISGVLAAYIVLFPHGRIVTLIILGIFITTTMLPAWVMIGYWIVLQLIQGAVSFGVRTAQTGGVAYFAHIGGFVAGLLLVWIFRNPDRLARQRAARRGDQPSRRWPERR